MTSRRVNLKVLLLALVIALLTSACDLLSFASSLDSGDTAAPTLTQTFTDSYGMFALSYPEGWVISDFGDHVTFASTERALEVGSTGGVLSAGEVVVDVQMTLMIDLEGIAQSANPNIDIIGGEHVVDLMTVLVDASADPASGLPLMSEMEQFTVSGHDAVRVNIAMPPNEVTAYLVEYPDDVVIRAIVTTSAGERASVDSLVRALLDTITVTPPAN